VFDQAQGAHAAVSWVDRMCNVLICCRITCHSSLFGGDWIRGRILLYHFFEFADLASFYNFSHWISFLARIKSSLFPMAYLAQLTRNSLSFTFRQTS